MKSLGVAGEDGTFLIGFIAYRYHNVELFVTKEIERFGLVCGDIDPTLAHGLNGEGMHESGRMSSGTDNFKGGTAKGAQQSFGNLASR
jgi:hypothetical protein